MVINKTNKLIKWQPDRQELIIGRFIQGAAILLASYVFPHGFLIENYVDISMLWVVM
jgi:hypothetical protein